MGSPHPQKLVNSCKIPMIPHQKPALFQAGGFLVPPTADPEVEIRSPWRKESEVRCNTP